LGRIFDRSNGKQWDYVFNCGGETRYSQEEEVYKVRSLNLSMAAGKEAAKRGVKVFVEVSTGMVYKPEAAARKESDKTKPWMKMAKYKLMAEEELAKIPDLNLVVLRVAHVYGEYDTKFVATALTLAKVYQHLGKEMKWLWTKDLRVNTVHVQDVARALYQAAEWYAAGKKGWDASWGKVPLFNIVDHGDTCKQWAHFSNLTDKCHSSRYN
jgi:dTDP-4-dehydrorhamnose reductase